MTGTADDHFCMYGCLVCWERGTAPRPVADRILDRLHAEALAEDEEREWQRTGRIRCSDCGTAVRTETLISLPEHGCTRRQTARRRTEATRSAHPDPPTRQR